MWKLIRDGSRLSHSTDVAFIHTYQNKNPEVQSGGSEVI